jgi:tetraacyldisaccharide 4'-kinase
VGIVSRGHGGTNVAPRAVSADDDPRVVGDEPPLLAATGLPVFIGHDRVAAARALLAAHPACRAILADDGLQHYALGREVEIAVIDGVRGFGNGRMLPAGPLREPVARLGQVDAIVRLVADPHPPGADERESAMTYEPLPWVNLRDRLARPDPRAWRGTTVHALAGIGHPQRFFDTLHAQGIAAVEHVFPDHHPFVAGDLAWEGATAILMTQKDAVKCRGFADARCWYLPIRARIDPALVERVLALTGTA